MTAISKTFVRYRFAMVAGGCPYPGIDGREVANKLKYGYRIPKPKHTDQQL